MLCRRNALIRSKELGISERLFLNVCPSLLQANDHERGVTAALLEELGIERSNITFELTERTLIEDYGLFNRVLSYYREQGYSIAIDDLGSGYAGLKMLAQLEPEYVKLARFLVSDIDTSATRQALVEALVTFCGKIGAKVIAEGIERKEELDLLTQMGVSFGQGYLLARPSNAPVSCSSILHR
ncbi:EAL domain-containing protein [Geotalea toluenoxydans]|nr:EAL domain-containing protein [Geotalea toluenoxydans]